MSKAYLIGPMRGLPRFNFDEFERVVALVREDQPSFLTVVSPAEMDLAEGFNPDEHDPNGPIQDLKSTFARDIAEIITCDQVLLMRGWEKSRLGTLELILAMSIGASVSIVSDTGLLYAAQPLDLIKSPLVRVWMSFSGEYGEDQRHLASKGLEWLSLVLRKNLDYGGSAWKSPVLEPGLRPRTAIRVRMSDKIERLSHLSRRGGEIDEERVEDTMQDLGAYALLWSAYKEPGSDTDAVG